MPNSGVIPVNTSSHTFTTIMCLRPFGINFVDSIKKTINHSFRRGRQIIDDQGKFWIMNLPSMVANWVSSIFAKKMDGVAHGTTNGLGTSSFDIVQSGKPTIPQARFMFIFFRSSKVRWKKAWKVSLMILAFGWPY